MINIHTALQAPKDFDNPNEIEDAFFPVEPGDSKCLVISDGATESFDSKTWAKLLVDNFVESCNRKGIDIEAVINASSDKYKSKYRQSELPWSQQLAYQRGSFATILGVQNHNDLLLITGIGDSNLFLFLDDKLVFCFPYTNALDFRKNPILISTHISHNSFIQNAETFYVEFNLNKNKINNYFLVLASDALSEWIFYRINDADYDINELLNINDENGFKELIKEERNSKRMKTDDVSLIIATISKD